MGDVVVGTEWNAAAVPVAVVLHDADDVITVRVHKLRPRLPQRMYDVVDEADLRRHNHRSVLNILDSLLAHQIPAKGVVTIVCRIEIRKMAEC